MIIDNESEPGSWERELKKMPWGYGQSQTTTVKKALEDLRFYNFLKQADTLEQEILTLRRELEYLRNKDGQ
jgi:hypothetical protein